MTIYKIISVKDKKVKDIYLSCPFFLHINIWAMSNGVQLKEMAMLESLGYIFVPILSVVSLDEQVGKREMFGILLIMIGMIVFYQ